MTKLPRGLSGRKVIKALERAGFYVKRKKGSHVVMRRDNPFAQVVVPNHRSVDTGTLDVIIEGADLTIDEFIQMLK
ncbi:MAG: type II toxin-antitoxin system HicA family toxin [Thermodesulfobacteriota bacterium]|nr:type II toxin-antitoxin system HicA family toxin [Thermodesulfobacteriota bacterium]